MLTSTCKPATVTCCLALPSSEGSSLMLQVRKGHLVFDPFAGTGSILIAAAHLGAYTLGSDIDIRVLRDGKTTSNGQVHLVSRPCASLERPGWI